MSIGFLTETVPVRSVDLSLSGGDITLSSILLVRKRRNSGRSAERDPPTSYLPGARSIRSWSEHISPMPYCPRGHQQALGLDVKEGFLAVKVDMEQAYDRMSWQTLRQVLVMLGFPSRFANWLLKCVQDPTFTLVINGRRSSWIEGGCGFRQGFPLSPYLFILCYEFLSFAIHASTMTLGFPLSNGGAHLSHMLYADDVLVFLRANVAAVRECTGLLNAYCGWTGQRTNNAKSMLMASKAMPRWKANRMAHMIGS
ncbi:hypothetical protein KSP39_PZI008355 [Platanthera zijinensis]|uniref:Reverse transcriptase domain-containing protein n=1 Tax=Platanthera zijinensis TaxID=2320716 RepID=A0AAP0BNI9_9ASPA